MTKNRIIIKRCLNETFPLMLRNWRKNCIWAKYHYTDSSRATQFTEGNHHDFDFQSCSIFISIMLLQKHRHLR